MMLELFVNKVNLQPQFIVNIFLVVLKLTLNVFYLLFINLVWYTSQFMVAFLFAQISLQTMTKLQQAFKGVLSYCKLEFFFKCRTRLSNSFQFKNPIPKDLISGVVYKCQRGVCNESYYGERIRHLGIRSGE